MATNWIELDGTANTRDLGGIPSAAGTIAPNVVIRSDNLQDLSPRDVSLLTALPVTLVVDLRTPGEVEVEGPTALQDAGVDYVNLSFVPELRTPSGQAVEPGQDERILPDRAGQDRLSVYLNYLRDMPGEVVEAVRRIAHTSGATIIHCAAGKDRTGTLAAMLLSVAEAEPTAIIEDYVATAEVIDAVMARLAARPIYAHDLAGVPRERHVPQAETIEAMLVALDKEWGGAAGWLLAHGLSEADLALVKARLLGRV